MEEYGGNIIVEAGLNAENFDAGAAKLENRMKKAAKNVAKAERNLDALNKKLRDLQAAKVPTEEFANLTESVASAEKRLTQLTRRQDEMKAVGTNENSKAWQRVQNEIDRTVRKLENYDAAMQRMEASGAAYTQDSAAIEQTRQKIDEAATTLERYQIEQREAAQAVSEYNAQEGQASAVLQTVSDRMEKFRRRVIGLAKRVFVFTMITKALRAMRSALMSTIGADAQMSNSLAQIKGNLITAFAPIYNFVVPAIRTLLSWIAKLTATIATFVNSLFGKTAAQASESAKALYDQAHATAAAGGAAEKAEKQLASFDTINKLSSNENSGGGGGASGTSPQFDLENQVDTAKIEKVAEVVKQIWPYVAAIAAGFAMWKIGKALFGDLNKAKIAAFALAGAVLMVISFIDMLKNGVNGDNLTMYIAGAVLLVGALAVAFGSVGAAIGLAVAGIGLLITGIKDAIANGFSKENFIAISIGILAIVAAIGLAFGGIPALVALAIGAIGLLVGWIVSNWEAVKQWWNNTIAALSETWNSFWEEMSLWAKQKLDDIIGFFTGLGQSVSDIATKIGEFFSNTWNDVKNGANSAWEGIKSVFGTVADWFEDIFSKAWEKVKNVFSTGGKIWSGIKEGIENTFRTVVNKIIDGMNKIVAWPFNKINSMLNTIKDLSFLGISPFKNLWSYNPLPVPKIPALAKGAVIPGGRAFLSVLGDQPAGQTNIETPLETMIDAFRKAGAGKQTIIIKIGDTEFKRFVYDAYNSEARRIGKSYA